MLGQLVGYGRELDELVQVARQTEAGTDPQLRDRLARAWIGLEGIRAYPLDTPGQPAGARVEGRLSLSGRAETIYGGPDEIQRNTISARALGLPRPVRG